MPNPAPEPTGPQPTAAARTWRLHTNVDRTILLTTEPDGTIQVAFRDHPGATWGPPITLNPTA